MRHILVTATLLLCGAFSGRAQHSHGYVFFGPGSSDGSITTLSSGGGFEVLVYKRFVGVGAEAGYITPARNLDAGLGVVSPNAYFHIPAGRFSNVDPYVTAGYSLLFRTGSVNAFNYGGGLNWWLMPRAGLKLEIRDHTREGTHLWAIRFGLTLR